MKPVTVNEVIRDEWVRNSQMSGPVYDSQPIMVVKEGVQLKKLL